MLLKKVERVVMKGLNFPAVLLIKAFLLASAIGSSDLVYSCVCDMFLNSIFQIQHSQDLKPRFYVVRYFSILDKKLLR